MLSFNAYWLPSDPSGIYEFVSEKIKEYQERVKDIPNYHVEFEETFDKLIVKMDFNTVYALAKAGDGHAKAHIKYLASKL